MSMLINSYRFAGPTTYVDEVNADSPVGYWRLGESSGTTATDESGTQNGTYNGSPTLGVTGALSGDSDTAVDFDGTDDYVDIPDNAAWDVSNITVEAWVKIATVSSFNMIFSREPGTSDTTNRQFQFRVTNTGKLQFIVFGSDGSSLDSSTSAASVDDNTFHHVVGTYDGATIRTYIDGSADGTKSFFATFNDSNRPPQIGRNEDVDLQGHFDGTIDEVAFYDSVLSATRITAHYDAGTA